MCISTSMSKCVFTHLLELRLVLYKTHSLWSLFQKCQHFLLHSITVRSKGVCLHIPLSDLKAPLSLFKTHTHTKQSTIDFSLVSERAGSGLAPGQSFSPDLHCQGDRCSGHSTSQEARIPAMWKSMPQSSFKLSLPLPSLFLRAFCSVSLELIWSVPKYPVCIYTLVMTTSLNATLDVQFLTVVSLSTHMKTQSFLL